MAKSDDGGSALIIGALVIVGYYLYTRFTTTQGITITPQTYASAPPTPPGQIFIGPPSPGGTTGSTTAPTDVGGIVMGPGY